MRWTMKQEKVYFCIMESFEVSGGKTKHTSKSREGHVMLEMRKRIKRRSFSTKGEKITQLKVISRESDAAKLRLQGDEPSLLCNTACVRARVFVLHFTP